MGTITTWKATDDQHHCADHYEAATRVHVGSDSGSAEHARRLFVHQAHGRIVIVERGDYADRCGSDVRIDGADGGKLGSGGDRRHIHDFRPISAIHGGLAMGEFA